MVIGFSMLILSDFFLCHSVISLVGSKYMSPDDYKRANRRLYVFITKFKGYELSNELVSEFESNTDMYGALCASSQIPFLNCFIFSTPTGIINV